ncbi:hypothetical protein SUGI_1057230 [Cryptomeria japonica]|uniref:pentatricopeptide repeat-containing protein At1g09410, mitochondrial n=1 Tax=Cryptomeria japonica TaxID=3369 RepID=UPI00241485CD|nr:pentatricopeptide repeat-containing protein At1g09410, mitochondrial [Cryptomeria japonica]GLJ49785.1 hypothetical protein SUGI_1057230 [Cryptomeria japonica]
MLRLCNHKTVAVLNSVKPTFMTNAIARPDNHIQLAGNYNAEQSCVGKLKALCKQGWLNEALEVLNFIPEPNDSVYASLLQACIHNKALPEAKLVHAHIIITGFKPDVHLDTKLVIMYTKFLCLEDARQVFENMSESNVVTWTALMGAYSRNARPWDALALFYQMQRSGISSDRFVFPSVLPACAALEALHYGQELQGFIVRNGFQHDVFVASALVDMYFKCGRTEEARKVFDKIQERDTVLWNTLLSGYAYNGHMQEAMGIFQRMPKPNVFSWNTVIDGFGENGQVDEALKLFQKMPERDVFSWTAMIAGLLRSDLVDKAMELFREISHPDMVSWNQMIIGYTQSGRVEEAMKLFDEMPEKDLVSWNTMITGFVQNGHVQKALDLFRRMPNRCVISWNAIVAGHTQNGNFSEALLLFREMRMMGMKPNGVTFVSVLPACANLAALEHGKAVHEDIIKSGFESDTLVGNSLVDMYAKCGSIEDAQIVFDNMPAWDVVSWNAIIVGNAVNGFGKEALELFEKMKSLHMKPNHVTFIGVLSACCHAGLVDDGWKYFNSMNESYHVTPAKEHYCCMVDLLGRVGHLYEAYNLVTNMPVKPNATVWASLLASCRICSNIELGERVAEFLFQSDTKSPGHYVLLSNIYAAAGRWDNVGKVRKLMKERGVIKTPGSSWIEVNNKMYAFVVGDRSHPQTQEIYAELERLCGQMKETGYVPDTDFALHDVEEEQKEHILGYHSEKLAVVFGLINTSPMKPIRVIKNLRVCGDCHSAIKFISKIAGREVILRDGIRFHHFTNGQCSCGDHW